MSRTMVVLRNLALALSMPILVLLVAGAGRAAATQVYSFGGDSFGPGGTGAGTFVEVVSVAVDRGGDVLVYDGGEGGRIYKFDAAGEPVDFSSTSTNVIEGVGATGGQFGEIAVDNSLGPDSGDIYVANNAAVRIYSAAGSFLGELSGGEMCGVAVDSTGAVYVAVLPEVIRKYEPHANPVTNGDESSSLTGANVWVTCDVAADSEGNLYGAYIVGGVTRYSASQFGLPSAKGTLIDPTGLTLSVDFSNDVFVNGTSSIVQYDSTGAKANETAPSGLSGSF
jgi:hypothetical protein